MSAAPSGETGRTVPTIDRAWELAELAYSDDGMTVLGWTDDMVVTFARPRPTRAVQFVATPEVQKSHEDEVLIIAVRVPHPDEMSLDEVINGVSLNGGSTEP